MEKIRIITRNSRLALWQADFVKEQLLTHYPDMVIEIIGTATMGDRILDKSLAKIGGKGLFTKELEKCLLDNTADIAVHSLKDLPAKLNPEFTLAAILKREDAADAFVSNTYQNLDSMPDGATIGTSAPRRVAILKQYYPHLQVKLLRGNIPTRIKHLDNGEYDAIILAIAGLNRLNLANRITQRLDINKFLPAIGQGALAIEILSSRIDLSGYMKPLEDVATFLEVTMERELGTKLGASCYVPMAIYAKSIGDEVILEARLWNVKNNHCVCSQVQMPKSRSDDAISYCFDELYRYGAKEIIAQYE